MDCGVVMGSFHPHSDVSDSNSEYGENLVESVTLKISPTVRNSN